MSFSNCFYSNPLFPVRLSSCTYEFCKLGVFQEHSPCSWLGSALDQWEDPTVHELGRERSEVRRRRTDWEKTARQEMCGQDKVKKQRC